MLASLTFSVLLLAAPLPACPPDGEAAALLAERRLTDVRFESARVADAVTVLRDRYKVPLLFVEADPSTKVTLNVAAGTVAEVLAALAAQAEGYALTRIDSRFVLHPREDAYGMNVRGLRIDHEARLGAAYRLVAALKELAPFSKVEPPVVAGVTGLGERPVLYSDPVTIRDNATVLEALVDLAGARPSVVVSIAWHPTWKLSMLGLGLVPQWQAVTASAPKRTIAPGESVVLDVSGVDPAGVLRNLGGGRCGVQYSVDRADVAGIDASGLLAAKVPGRVTASAQIDGELATVVIDVAPPPGAKAK